MPSHASSSAAVPTAASPCVDVWTDAGEHLTLGPAQFVASGGEGDVYAIGDRGFKLAHDPARACPPAKLAELARIADPYVLAPRGSLHRGGPRRAVVGHELPFMAEAFTACELVPVAFRRRHGLDPTVVPALVESLRQRVAAVHAARCVVVDLSEANVLVSRDFRAACLIDVDSFQTPSFAATAIVPAVRDPLRASGFDERTDWFSFAVVAFSLLVGIHPYRGKHPRVVGLEARMQAGLSVFDPAVRVPRACLPVSSIPEPWRGWLRAVLQHGERTAPPVPTGGSFLQLGAGAHPRALAASLRMIEVAGPLPAEVRGLYEAHGRLVIHAGDRVIVDGEERLRCSEALAIASSPSGRPVAAWVQEGMLRLFDLDAGSPIPCQAAARAVTSARGRLFATCGDEVVRVELLEVGERIMAGVRRAVMIAPQSSRLWRGCVIQQLLGTTTVSLLSETGAAEQRRVPELDGLTVVDAVHDRGVLVAVVARGGAHERLVIRFSPRGGHHVRREADLAAHAAQLCVLDTGVCVSLDADDRLELQAKDPAAVGAPRLVDDPAVAGDWLLHAGDGRLLVAVGRAVFEVTMRRRTS